MERDKGLNGLLSSLKNSGEICYIHRNVNNEARHLKGVVVDFDEEIIYVRRPLGERVAVIKSTVTSIDMPNMEEEP